MWNLIFLASFKKLVLVITVYACIMPKGKKSRVLLLLIYFYYFNYIDALDLLLITIAISLHILECF
jgi:hypothetical protein